MNEPLEVEKFMKKYDLKPMDISQERFDKIVEERFTYEVYLNRTIYEDVVFRLFIVDGKSNYIPFRNEKGDLEICIVTTDYEVYRINRLDLKYVFLQNSKIFNDRFVEYTIKQRTENPE
jgi:hypothetical protein